MSTDNIMQLIYLMLLLVAVGGWFIAQNRAELGKNAQYAVIWGLIFMGVIAVAGLWNDIRANITGAPTVTAERIEIPRDIDGHFSIDTRVNGARVSFLIDTGATNIVLNKADAEAAGIDTSALRYTGSASTANGRVNMARVRLDKLVIGDLTETNLTAYVNDGALEQSLLGMDFLQRFGEFTIRRDRLILQR